MTREEVIKILQNIYFEAPEIKEAMQIAIEALSGSSLPSNLDDAAHEFEDKALSGYDDICVTENGEERPVLKYNFTDAFKAGAEWMAGQGASYNTEVGWIDGPTVLDWPDDILDGFKMGDKVIVQIRKKTF